MDAERELILHIDPGSATIKVESRFPEGSIITKRIGYNALVECIKGSLQREMIQSGLLPTGCISFDAGNDGWRYVAIEHPARYADITYGTPCTPIFPCQGWCSVLACIWGCGCRSAGWVWWPKGG